MSRFEVVKCDTCAQLSRAPNEVLVQNGWEVQGDKHFCDHCILMAEFIKISDELERQQARRAHLTLVPGELEGE